MNLLKDKPVPGLDKPWNRGSGHGVCFRENQAESGSLGDSSEGSEEVTRLAWDAMTSVEHVE